VRISLIFQEPARRPAQPSSPEEFESDLDASLDARGPSALFDFVAGLDLAPGSIAVDVGCCEGTHAVSLAERFGFVVTGIDPVPRHVEVAREVAGPNGPTFVLGSAESLPIPDGSVDLIWCRDVLVHVADLPSVYTEFRRMLRRGGRVMVYQMLGTDLLEEREAAFLWDTMGVVAESADPACTDAAIAAAGLRVDECVASTAEWGEYAQERGGKVGRKLLHAARLQRDRDKYLQRYGQAIYDLKLGDCLWHVYAMIGKLTRRAYLLTAP
jgi:SAM-dependent methyltransferase